MTQKSLGRNDRARDEMEVWRLLPHDRDSSLTHFARSDALARLVRRPTVWWHSTDRPTLILGAGQRVDDSLRRAAEERGVRVVRRQSGGTAVFASADVLGLDIALPAGHRLVLSDVVEGYRWLGEVWMATLAEFGVDAHLATVDEVRSMARPPDDLIEVLRAACFGTLSPYEVQAGRRKLVGLAQVRRRTGALLQSAVHHHFDADALGAILHPEAPDMVARALAAVAIGLEELTGEGISPFELMTAFERRLQHDQHLHLQPGAWTPDEIAHVESYLAQPSVNDTVRGDAASL